jgi:hypothetical protein
MSADPSGGSADPNQEPDEQERPLDRRDEEYWRPAFAVLLDEARRSIDSQLQELSLDPPMRLVG